MHLSAEPMPYRQRIVVSAVENRQTASHLRTERDRPLCGHVHGATQRRAALAPHVNPERRVRGQVLARRRNSRMLRADLEDSPGGDRPGTTTAESGSIQACLVRPAPFDRVQDIRTIELHGPVRGLSWLRSVAPEEIRRRPQLLAPPVGGSCRRAEDPSRYSRADRSAARAPVSPAR